jgi:hypothetical protein
LATVRADPPAPRPSRPVCPLPLCRHASAFLARAVPVRPHVSAGPVPVRPKRLRPIPSVRSCCPSAYARHA